MIWRLSACLALLAQALAPIATDAQQIVNRPRVVQARKAGLWGGVPAPAPPATVGLLLGGFETATDWTAAAGYTVSLDPARKVQGAYSLRHAPSTALNNTRTYKDFAGFDMTQLGTVAAYVALEDDYDWQNASAVSMATLIGATGTIYTIAVQTQLNLYNTGGLWISGSRAQAPAAVQAAGTGTHRFQMSNTLVSSKVTDQSYDAVYYGVGGKAGLILSFDDCFVEAYTRYFPIMQPLGIVGEINVATALVGTTGKLTWAQISELAAAGWVISLDGTRNDGAFNNLPSVADALAELEAGKAELVSRGFPAPNAFVYPFGFGGARTNGARVEKTGVTTSGNIVTLADTSGITTGMRFIALGAKRTNRVQSVGSGSVTLNDTVETAGSNLAASFVDDSGPFHGKKLQTALRAAGWKWGRSTYGSSMFVQYGVSPDMAIEYPATAGDNMTLASFQALMQPAIDNKKVLTIYTHNLWSQAEFQASMNWFKTQMDAGLAFSATTKLLDQMYGNVSPP